MTTCQRGFYSHFIASATINCDYLFRESPSMSAPRGSMPVVYHDDAEMQNGGNGGEGSVQIVPQVVQSAQVEEIGTLVPQAALEAIPGQPTMPGQPFPLFESSRIFVHAPAVPLVCCSS